MRPCQLAVWTARQPHTFGIRYPLLFEILSDDLLPRLCTIAGTARRAIRELFVERSTRLALVEDAAA